MRCEEIRELLSAYIDGELDEAGREALDAHLGACSSCSGELVALRSTVQLTSSLGQVEPPHWLRDRLLEQFGRDKAGRSGYFSTLRSRLAAMRYGRWTLAAALAIILISGTAINMIMMKSQATPGGPVAYDEFKAGGAGIGGTAPKSEDLSVAEAPKEAGAKLQLAPEGAPEAKAGAYTEEVQPGVSRAREPETSPDRWAYPGRKVIKRAELAIEVQDFDKAYRGALSMAETAGGYVERSSVSTSREGKKSAWLTLRVPEGSFVEVLDRLRALGTVRNDTVTSEDVTRQYIDNKARLRTLESQEMRLLALLEKARNLDEVLMLERELVRVRSEIEMLAGQVRYLENVTALSTVHLQLYEPGTIEPEPPGILGQTRDAFLRTVKAILDFTTRLVIFLGGALPVLILAAVAYLVFRRYLPWSRSGK